MTTPRRLLVMCDYFADPLWSDDGALGENLDSFPLTEDTKAALRSWARWYDAGLDRDDECPAEETRRFEAEGLRLTRLVAAELGPEYEVGFRP